MIIQYCETTIEMGKKQEEEDDGAGKRRWSKLTLRANTVEKRLASSPFAWKQQQQQQQICFNRVRFSFFCLPFSMFLFSARQTEVHTIHNLSIIMRSCKFITKKRMILTFDPLLTQMPDDVMFMKHFILFCFLDSRSSAGLSFSFPPLFIAMDVRRL